MIVRECAASCNSCSPASTLSTFANPLNAVRVGIDRWKPVRFKQQAFGRQCVPDESEASIVREDLFTCSDCSGFGYLSPLRSDTR